MNTSVENYFTEGCGRCPLGGTPDCKVHSWSSELLLLRTIISDCGLKEEAKWGAPCYTLSNKNILMLSALKDYCCISFFKGLLLTDSNRLLVKPGPNTHAARLLKFRYIKEIIKNEKEIRAYIADSIEIEKAGKQIPLRENSEPIPEEFKLILEEDPVLKTAFETLSSRKQRGYIIHFSNAKQVKTRKLRIEKCISTIMAGIGLHDKYQSTGR